MMKSNFKSYGYLLKSNDQFQPVQILLKRSPNGHCLEIPQKIDLPMKNLGDTPQLKKETVEQII